MMWIFFPWRQSIFGHGWFGWRDDVVAVVLLGFHDDDDDDDDHDDDDHTAQDQLHLEVLPPVPAIILSHFKAQQSAQAIGK